MPSRSSPATYVSLLKSRYNHHSTFYNLISHTKYLQNQLIAPRRLPNLNPPRSQTIPRPAHFSTSHAMASDDDYMAFLNKANADKDAGSAPTPSQGVQTKTVDTSLQLPASLKNVDTYYVSESDEPFEPVLLRWEGAVKGEWPSADAFSSLISPNNDISQGISTISPSSFDPRNQYTAVVEAVRAAASDAKDIKIYRVELTSTQLEYFVVALDSSEGGRVIGLKALAVES